MVHSLSNATIVGTGNTVTMENDAQTVSFSGGEDNAVIINSGGDAVRTINGRVLNGRDIVQATGGAIVDVTVSTGGVGEVDADNSTVALNDNATATVNNTTFLRNLAQGGAGGAGANGGEAIGGAIAVGIGNVSGNSDTSSLAMTAGLVTGNFAKGGRPGSGGKGGNAWGGGAWVGADGSASFDQSDILLNEALSVLFGNGEGKGGGLYVDTGAVVTLHKSTVAQNLASTSNNNIWGSVIYV